MRSCFRGSFLCSTASGARSLPLWFDTSFRAALCGTAALSSTLLGTRLGARRGGAGAAILAVETAGVDWKIMRAGVGNPGSRRSKPMEKNEMLNGGATSEGCEIERKRKKEKCRTLVISAWKRLKRLCIDVLKHCNFPEARRGLWHKCGWAPAGLGGLGGRRGGKRRNCYPCNRALFLVRHRCSHHGRG